MANTPIDQATLDILRSEMRKVAEDVVAAQTKTAKYTVAQVPNHTHNNIDSNSIPAENINAFIKLPATVGGVASSGVLDGQTINQAFPQSTVTTPSVLTPSIPYIWGFGVGAHSAFNGGDAPDGSIVYFHNAGINEIWYRVDGQWWGFAATLGPL